MADIHYLIRQGIYTKLTGTTNTFKTAITTGSSTRLYYHIAKQGDSLPYVVFDILPINQDRDSNNKFYDCIIQFKISSSTLGNDETVAGYLTDQLEDCESTLTVTGYTITRIERQPQISLGIDDNIWNTIVQYRLQVQI